MSRHFAITRSFFRKWEALWLTRTRRDDQISQQIDVLNEDYEDTGLTFVLANTTRTVNETWFKTVGPDTDVQTDMKNQLRQGDEAALNVYTVGYVMPPTARAGRGTIAGKTTTKITYAYV